MMISDKNILEYLESYLDTLYNNSRYNDFFIYIYKEFRSFTPFTKIGDRKINNLINNEEYLDILTLITNYLYSYIAPYIDNIINNKIAVYEKQNYPDNIKQQTIINIESYRPFNVTIYYITLYLSLKEI